MKKIITIMMVFSLMIMIKDSFAQWIIQNTYDSIKSVNSSFFINENTGWLSGTKGRVSKTTTGGLLWQKKVIDYNVNFYAIKFLNSTTGFVCGNNGKIYKSIDGGDNWSSLTTNNTDTLCSLDFIDLNTGWCIGYHSILKTTNQGTNWFTQNYNFSSPILQLKVIKMYNSLEGLLGGVYWVNPGENSYVFKTSNGGINWNFVDSLQGYFPSSINYTDQQTVFLSNYSYIYKSTNGGINWQYNFYLTGGSGESKIKFLDINSGWALKNNNILRTTNGGYNWIEINSIFGEPFTGLDCFSSGVIYSFNLKGGVYKTTNAGINWGNFSCDTYNHLNSISILDANTVVISGLNGTLIKTTDGGTFWQQKFRENLNWYVKTFFINNNTGYCISNEKSLIKTTNGGDNWIIYNNVFPKYPLNIYCTDESNFYVTGDSGMVLKTTNSGQNWINISPDSVIRYNWIRASGNNILLEADPTDSYGFLYRSENGGNSWTPFYFDSLYHLSVSFLNEQTGWVFSTSKDIPIFYKTTNFGNNWSKNNFIYTGGGHIGKINFTNENTGYAITYAYEIIKTTDGGYNWLIQINQLREYTFDVAFMNSFTGWVICNAGTIFKTTNGGSTYINTGNINIPGDFLLYQNYPNPFNPTTKIRFEIAQHTPYLLLRGENVSLKVFDIMGREIQTLVNENLNPGTYEVTFDGSNLPSGLYFYQLRAGEFVDTKKLVLLK